MFGKTVCHSHESQPFRTATVSGTSAVGMKVQVAVLKFSRFLPEEGVAGGVDDEEWSFHLERC